MAAGRVLFACVGNSCRSPMAAALFDHHARRLGLRWGAASAGIRPAARVHHHAVTVLAERGIDLAAHCPRGLAPKDWQRYDRVIALDPAVREACPADFSGVLERWEIEDPFDGPPAAYRAARDRIEGQVLDLIKRLMH